MANNKGTPPIKVDIFQPDPKKPEAVTVAVSAMENGLPKICRIQISDNGVPADEPLQTDDQGNASKVMVLSGGAHTISAQVMDTSIKGSKSVFIPQTDETKKTKAPNDLKLEITRTGAITHLLIQVLLDDKGIKANVLIADSSRSKPIEIETDEKGHIDHILGKITDRRDVTVTVSGTKLSGHKRVYPQKGGVQ